MTDFAAQLDRAAKQLLRIERQKLQASRNAYDRWGADVQAAMRQNAVWLDQTGEARAHLKVEPSHPTDVLHGAKVTLIHGVAYGIHLELPPGKRRPPQPLSVEQVLKAGGAIAELAGGSKYAIVQPTFGRLAPQLIADIQRIWQG
ncbi:MAG: hypothetical protein M3Q08_16820 [Pseudomonadota bacterium]|nr:hypothetical protein [Pseudomonadota bacterium]